MNIYYMIYLAACSFFGGFIVMADNRYDDSTPLIDSLILVCVSYIPILLLLKAMTTSQPWGTLYGISILLVSCVLVRRYRSRVGYAVVAILVLVLMDGLILAGARS